MMVISLTETDVMINAELNRFFNVLEGISTDLMSVLKFVGTATIMVSMNAMIGTSRMETDVTQLATLKQDGTAQEVVTQPETIAMKYVET